MTKLVSTLEALGAVPVFSASPEVATERPRRVLTDYDYEVRDLARGLGFKPGSSVTSVTDLMTSNVNFSMRSEDADFTKDGELRGIRELDAYSPSGECRVTDEVAVASRVGELVFREKMSWKAAYKVARELCCEDEQCSCRAHRNRWNLSERDAITQPEASVADERILDQTPYHNLQAQAEETVRCFDGEGKPLAYPELWSDRMYHKRTREHRFHSWKRWATRASLATVRKNAGVPRKRYLEGLRKCLGAGTQTVADGKRVNKALPIWRDLYLTKAQVGEIETLIRRRLAGDLK